MRHAILLILILAVGGCTSISGGGPLLTLQADPPTVFSNSLTTLHIDLDNRQEKSIRNVRIELFDTGLLKSDACTRFFPRMLPREFQSLSCRLYAPSIEEKSVVTEVNVLVSFESEFTATQIFEIIDEPEYLRRTASGSFETAPRSYTYNDKNVMVEVDFSEPLPLVIRPGKQYFVYFTITNVGNGFIGDINPADFLIEHGNILKCPQLTTLYPSGKAFPRIACELVLPPGYLVNSARNADFIINLRYNYELRDGIRINVLK